MVLHLRSPPCASYGCKAVSATYAVGGIFIWKTPVRWCCTAGMEILGFFGQCAILGGSSGRKVAQCLVYTAGIQQLRIQLYFFD